MKLNIKLTSGLKFSTEFNGETVFECKQHLTDEHSCAAPNRQRLVYKGRILDDGKKLKDDYEIMDGSTLFLVAMQGTAATSSPAAVATTASSPPPAGNSSGTPTTTPATTEINRLIQQMTQMQTHNYPPAAAMSPSPGSSPAGANSPTTSATSPPTSADPFSSSNPMLQSLMNSNPDFLTNMMQSQMENNPALRRLMDENPVVREALQDPAALRQMIQTMNNPELRAQQQRHHDLALANIENMPGGFNMLRNLYETVQVPMEEAASGNSAQAGGSSASSSSRSAGNTNSAATATSDTTAGATNQAMPNPWGSPRPSRTGSANRNAVMAPYAAMDGVPNPFGAMGVDPFAAMAGVGGGGLDPFAALGGGPGLGADQPSREQQEAAITMLESNPALQQMISASIRQNPAMLRQMMQGANPAAAAMMNNMSDDQLAGMMEMATNPAAMRGIMRMQDLMRQNNPNGMPNPMDMMALMGGAGGVGGVGGYGANEPFNGANPFLAGNPFAMVAPPAVANANAPNPWASSSSTTNAAAPTAAPSQPPAIRYARQLDQMRNMGFDDDVAALAALERANGNLNRAVDILLDSSSSGATAGGGDHTTTDT